jgi:hypothetical protein
MNIDPLKTTEKIVKDLHDEVGKRTTPALKRYPLLFLFLVVFGVASILHGFEQFANGITLFKEHPTILILIGIFLLILTGQLYKTLERMR